MTEIHSTPAADEEAFPIKKKKEEASASDT